MQSVWTVVLGFFVTIGFIGAVFAAAGDTVCPELALTPLQRFAGLITFGNIMLTGGILGSVIFLAWFLYLIRIPTAIYEFAGYLASFVLIFFAKSIPVGIDPIFTAFAGCIGFAAMMLVSAALHEWEYNEARCCSALAVTWAIVAMAHQSELIGFFAVMAFFGALGFFVSSYPFMTVIGFKDEDSLNRATGAAFILLAFFVFYHISGIKVPYAGLFTYGAYLVGSLVGFMGLLILAYEGYGNERGYIARQIPIIVAGIAALFFGSVLAIPEIQKIGGTFFGLYLPEKVCDVPTEDTLGYVLKGLVISCIALGAGYFVLRYQDFFAPYILMM